MFKRKFPTQLQLDATDCGPTCLRIIAKHYGKLIPIDTARSISNKDRVGTSLLGLSRAAEQLGFKSIGAKVRFADLLDNTLFPCIAFWNQKHFVVVYKIKNKRVYVSDPAQGRVKYDYATFKKHWAGSERAEEGVILLLEPTEKLYDLEIDETQGKDSNSLKFIGKYLGKYRNYLVQILLGLLVGSVLQLAFPFLLQVIIDVGIKQHNVSFIYLILFAQLFLFIGATSIDVIRRFLLIHISSRINIRLLSDFFGKIFRLPVSFYDSRLTGDLFQRIQDHERIEQFLTSGTLNILFSLINILVFSAVLFIYNFSIFLIFIAGTVCFVGWILFFNRQRSAIDFQLFRQHGENTDKNLELIEGMQEIKLNNLDTRKKWEWEWLQVKLFKINLKRLKIDNWQSAGSSLINEFKNIVITFYAAMLVLTGELTLGMMLSISYILGQINVPISQLLTFIQTCQDANLSAKRINDIYNKQEEKDPALNYVKPPLATDINLEKLYFRYRANRTGSYVLSNLNLQIPHGKTTAIVGASGSGKTTLLKLLLKFYTPTHGSIKIGHQDLALIDADQWRQQIGVVLQEGYIFPDTVVNNIAATDAPVDEQRLVRAAKIANIHSFITTLPMGYQSLLGPKGISVSTGQKQRILIARAVYKDPDYLFFDEATSALDAKNERIITENLNRFLAGKTAIIIAHRLSTVKNADQIIVLHQGRIEEIGTHGELVYQQGIYYHLIKNQLELGA